MFSTRVLAIAAIVLWCPACDRSAERSSGTDPTAAPQGSPRAVIERLLAARESGLYQPMDELVVPGRAHEVVKTLVAVDEFLHANQALCSHVREQFTLGLSRSIDQSHWGARLGVFSRYVELLQQRIEGNAATVSFTVDGQVPVQHARLLRTAGRWRYDPGPGYDPRLPAAFRQMARGLRQVLDDLKAERLSADAIQADPQRLIEEVRVRLLPGIKMLPDGD